MTKLERERKRAKWYFSSKLWSKSSQILLNLEMNFNYAFSNLDIFIHGVILDFLSLSVNLEFIFLLKLMDTNDVID